MAIAVEATSAGQTGETLQPSLTFSHTVPASLSNSVLIVGVSLANGTDHVSGVTYGGVSLTRIRSDATGAGSTHARSHLYRLLSPAAGTADVVVSVSTNSRIAAGAITFSGVDQTTPFGTSAGDSGISTGPATVDVSSAADEVVVDCVAKRNSVGLLTVGASQTQRWQENTTNVTTTNNVVGGGSTEAGAATVTMSWSWVLPITDEEWAISAVPLKPAAAGGGTILPRLQTEGLFTGGAFG